MEVGVVLRAARYHRARPLLLSRLQGRAAAVWQGWEGGAVVVVVQAATARRPMFRQAERAAALRTLRQQRPHTSLQLLQLGLHLQAVLQPLQLAQW